MLHIRADGNSEIGTGHVMRCLSIAKASETKGCKCIFVTADTEMHPAIEAAGFIVICLDSVWNDMEQEIDKMRALIEKQKIERLLIDSYFVTPDYLSTLHKLTYVIYMDDLDAFQYPCSELINYNIYAERLDYPARYPNTRLLLGPKYAPLREEFQNLPKRIMKEKVKKVLVTTGGSDPYNVAAALIKAAVARPKLKELEFHIVSGRFNSHLPELLELENQYSNIVVHSNVQNMAKLMLGRDIAVSAAGSTLYELCACGLPTVTFVLADNQIMAAEEFDRLGIMPYAGDVRDDLGVAVQKTCEIICEISSEDALRFKMAADARNLAQRSHF